MVSVERELQHILACGYCRLETGALCDRSVAWCMASAKHGPFVEDPRTERRLIRKTPMKLLVESLGCVESDMCDACSCKYALTSSHISTRSPHRSRLIPLHPHIRRFYGSRGLHNLPLERSEERISFTLEATTFGKVRTDLKTRKISGREGGCMVEVPRCVYSATLRPIVEKAVD